jgi:hypothetical protein
VGADDWLGKWHAQSGDWGACSRVVKCTGGCGHRQKAPCCSPHPAEMQHLRSSLNTFRRALHDARRAAVVCGTRSLATLFFALYARVLALLVLPLKPHEVVHTHVHVSPESRRSNGGDTLARVKRVEAAPGSQLGDLDLRPAVSFGGCGMLYPYQLGVAEYLSDVFDTQHVRAAGHSAGFAAALCVAIRLTTDTHWHVLVTARQRWAQRLLGFVADSEAAWMAPYMEALATHEKAICAAAADGRLCLGHTRVRRRKAGKWPPLRAGHAVTCSFPSLASFVHAVTVSQRCPPFYRAPGWLHGAWGLDGAFSSQFTQPPGVPDDRLHTVTVSPTNPLADIAPAIPFPPTWFCTLPSTDRWSHLKARGYADAAAKRELFLERGFKLRDSAPAESTTYA